MVRVQEAQLLLLPEAEEIRYLPEGPTWMGDGQFCWVAIQHGPEATTGSLNIFDLRTKASARYDLPGRPGFACPTDKAGVFLVGCERQLGLFNTADLSWTTIADGIDSDVTGTIINDGTCFQDNLVFGTKDLQFATPKAGLYLFRHDDQKLIRLRDDQICSNGKQMVSAGDQLLLYDIDTPSRKVVRYRLDLDGGRLEDCQTVIDLSDLEGLPDGMTLTADEKSAIISLYNPHFAEFGETRQYSLEDGSLQAIWRTPGSPQVTCPLLVESPSGSVQLVITTAIENMPADRRDRSPLAGALFIAETDFDVAPDPVVFHHR